MNIIPVKTINILEYLRISKIFSNILEENYDSNLNKVAQNVYLEKKKKVFLIK